MLKNLSVVVPVYNESVAVLAAYNAISRVCKAQLLEWDIEVIFVDDGSQDDSFSHLMKLCAEKPDVKVIKLVTNCGPHMAIRAGLEHATGDAACFLACDLQDPPELIPTMLEKLTGSVQLVLAVRSSRQDNWVSNIISRVFYFAARFLVSRRVPPSGASVFMMGKTALNILRQHKERNLTLEGLFLCMGLQYECVPYDRKKRQTGQSRWTLGMRLKLFADFFVGYSYFPLRLMSWLGILVALSGFVYALVVIVGRLTGWVVAGTGFAAIMVVLLIGQGTIMTMLGVLGEYVWRACDEARGRPRYIVEKYLTSNANTIESSEASENDVPAVKSDDVTPEE